MQPRRRKTTERSVSSNGRGAERTMKLTATITTEEPFTQLDKLFKTELERKHERSSITIKENNGNAVFHITANDTTALRAAVNTVTSTLGMYEKTKEATHDKH